MLRESFPAGRADATEKSYCDPTGFDWTAASPEERDQWIARNVLRTQGSLPHTTCPDAEFSLLKEVRGAWQEPTLLEMEEALGDTYLARREISCDTGSGLFDALHVLYHETGGYAYAIYLVASRWRETTATVNGAVPAEVLGTREVDAPVARGIPTISHSEMPLSSG